MFSHSFLLIILLSGVLLNCECKGIRNCSPLPQCCRTYVFSPACRGSVAKKSWFSPVFHTNEDLSNDLGTFPLDTLDYGNDNGNEAKELYKLVEGISDENAKSLSQLVKHPDYTN